MSFLNVKRRGCQPQKKRIPKKKPWDDTLTDLSAYQATSEEIAYRINSHKSKHAVSTHINRGLGSGKKGKRASPFKTNTHTRKLAIMKEVLYDQKQLQDVLEKSDTMMAVVKDLFGDDPRRFAGFPSVTAAPNAGDSAVASSLINLPPDKKTRSEMLSESMMDGSALNDLQETDTDEDSPQQPLRYQPKMNMQRFQQFLEAEEKNNTLSTISGQAGLSHLGQGLLTSQLAANGQSSQLPDQTNLTRMTSQDGTFQTPSKGDQNESIEILRPPKSAINNTDKVNKTKRRVPRPEPPEERPTNFSLQDLRKVLEGLENEIADYERVTGRRAPAEKQRQETFSGYTLSLVDSVTRLTRYLKECDLRLHAEMTVREQLNQDVTQCKALIDALTSDIITTQEEFHTLAFAFHRYKADTTEEIQRLKTGQVNMPGERPTMTNSNANPAEPAPTFTPPKSQGTSDDTAQRMPAPVPFGDHLKPVPAAVMLSPPVRRSRVMEPERDGDNNKRQGSLLEFPDIPSSVDGNDSSLQEEYAALPNTYNTSQAALSGAYGATQQSVPAQPATARQASSFSVTQRKPTGPAPINTVSVPRVTPLVQTNVQIRSQSEPVRETTPAEQLPQSFAQKHLPLSFAPRDKPKTLQEPKQADDVTTNDTGNAAPDREFLAFQISELNKQHAEAQMRLHGLINRQTNQEPQSQTSGEEERQQQERARQEVVGHQQHLQQQQLQQQQQQKLIAMVLQQQQKIEEQQMLQRQQQQVQPGQGQPVSQGQGHRQQTQGQGQHNGQGQGQHGSQGQRQPTQGQGQHFQGQGQHGSQGQRQPTQGQGQHVQGQGQHGSQGQRPQTQGQGQQNYQGHGQHMSQGQGQIPRPVPLQPSGGANVRESAEFPGYRPQMRQSGLPGYQISPNISPISQTSQNFRQVYQSVESQDSSMTVPANYGITVSLPKVDMDMSGGSPSPRHIPQTAR